MQVPCPRPLREQGHVFGVPVSTMLGWISLQEHPGWDPVPAKGAQSTHSPVPPHSGLWSLGAWAQRLPKEHAGCRQLNPLHPWLSTPLPCNAEPPQHLCLRSSLGMLGKRGCFF